MDEPASVAADAQVDAGERSRAEAMVALWDQVPFGPGERPHVLVELSAVRLAGFATGSAKLALQHGWITRAPGVDVPDEVLCALSPGFRAADDPLSALIGESARPDQAVAGDAAPEAEAEATSGSGSRQGRLLQITGARRGDAEFGTDRGPRMLPAWFLDIEDALGPAVVLDPDLERQSVPGESGALVVKARVRGAAEDADAVRDADGNANAGTSPIPASPPGESPAADVPPMLRVLRARLAPDGRTLTVGFMGNPAVYTDYPTGFAVEGRNAVAVVPIAVDRPLPRPRRPRTVRLRHLPWHRRPGRAVRWFVTTWVQGRRPIAARYAYAQQREVTAVLAEPLGGRVVADWRSGQPLSVELTTPQD